MDRAGRIAVVGTICCLATVALLGGHGDIFASAAALSAAVPFPSTEEGEAKSVILYEADDVFPSNWSGSSRGEGQRFHVIVNELQWMRAAAALPRGLVAAEGERLRTALAGRDRIVLVASLGQRPTGGYRVAIAKVTLQRAEEPGHAPVLVVDVRRRRPEPEDFVIQAFTHPYDAVIVSLESLTETAFHLVFVDDDGETLQSYRVQRQDGLWLPRPMPPAADD